MIERSIEFRMALPHEILEIRALICEAILEFSEYTAEVKEQECSTITISKLQTSMEDGLCVVAIVDNHLAGVCFGSDENGPIWLNWIAVDRRFVGQGIGAGLLEYFLVTCTLKGSKIWCTILKSNIISQKLFKSANFNNLCDLKNHWHGLNFTLWERHL